MREKHSGNRNLVPRRALPKESSSHRRFPSFLLFRDLLLRPRELFSFLDFIRRTSTPFVQRASTFLFVIPQIYSRFSGHYRAARVAKLGEVHCCARYPRVLLKRNVDKMNRVGRLIHLSLISRDVFAAGRHKAVIKGLLSH